MYIKKLLLILIFSSIHAIAMENISSIIATRSKSKNRSVTFDQLPITTNTRTDEKVFNKEKCSESTYAILQIEPIKPTKSNSSMLIDIEDFNTKFLPLNQYWILQSEIDNNRPEAQIEKIKNLISGKNFTTKDEIRKFLEQREKKLKEPKLKLYRSQTKD
ncbi:MAG: hypothetical protein JO129_03795 [Candidatus Dependentiae bacterium]|nr:hypothetical protein [Candidatus Dependentiae bacterium]